MSEPLSREELEEWIARTMHSYSHLLARAALHYLDRVAELEKDEALRGPRLQALADMSDRALSAEAGLAAAQEALQWIRDYTGPAPVANMRAYAAARLSSLARGGGQQEKP